MLALGKRSSHLSLQNILTAPYIHVFILCEMTGKSGTAQSKLSLELSKLSLLDTFEFSYYKYAFLNLWLSLLMSPLARWGTSKGLRCSFFSPAQKALVPLAAACWPASCTLDTCWSNAFSAAPELVHHHELTAACACSCRSLGGQAVWQGSRAKAQCAQGRKALLRKSSHQGRLSLVSQEGRLQIGETLAQVAQRSCGCPLPGSVQGQVGWSSEQPGLVEGVPARVGGWH